MPDPSSSYLATKYLPPYLRPDVVVRRRLVDALALYPGVRLALVSAPAGYGKSTLLACWRRELLEQGAAVAWLALDESDNDLGRFLKGMLQALIAALADEPEVTPDLEMLARAGAAQPDKLLDLLLQALARLSRLCVLVLDDLHQVSHPAVHHALVYLLDRFPPQMKLAIGSRADPSLPLARLRARGELVELRMADLRFSLEEAGSLVSQVHRLALAPEDLTLLEQRTEGWAAGLQLIGLSLNHWPEWAYSLLRPGENIQHVSAYLAEEVFHKLPEHVRSFLLYTSILDELSAGLCDALVDRPQLDADYSAAALLNWLEANNLFVIPLDPFGRQYRYHPLFGEFLRQTLRQTQPDVIPVLHARASRWYWQQGNVDQAIVHATRCNDRDWYIHLIEQSANDMITRSDLGRLNALLEPLPVSVFQTNAYLAIVAGWTNSLLGRNERVEPYLRMAEDSLPRMEAGLQDAATYPLDIAAMRMNIDTLRALTARLNMEWAASIELSERVLAQLPPGEQLLRSVLVFNLGQIYKNQYEIEKCRRILLQAERAGQASGNVYIQLVSLVILGQLSQYQGRMTDVDGYFQQALRLGYRPDGRVALPAVCFAEAWLGDRYRLTGQFAKASAHLDKALQIGELFGQGALLFDVYLNQMQLCLAHRDLPAAQAWLDKAAALPLEGHRAARGWIDDAVMLMQLEWGRIEETIPWAEAVLKAGEIGTITRMREKRLLTAVSVMQKAVEGGLCGGARLEACLETLRCLRRAAEDGGRICSLVEILVYQAEALHVLGRTAEARQTLAEARRLAGPAGWVQLFAGVSPELEPAAELPGVVAGLLTEREVELLRMAADGATNQEIAEHLYITVGTVKSHFNHIFTKLGARHRAEAISQARKQGLL